MLGTAAPATHEDSDLELIGSSNTDNLDSDIINEDLGSLDDLLSQVVRLDAQAEGKKTK